MPNDRPPVRTPDTRPLANVRRAIGSMPWAILPEKLDTILALLDLRAAGGRLTSDEIKARLGGVPQAADRRQAARRGTVAVLPVYGVIAPRLDAMTEMSGGTSAEEFTRKFAALAADPSVEAIVLDVDSPGGSVHGLDAAASAVMAARGSKRVVAVANNLMASAAYWIASAADEVIVTPTGEVGSIGVFRVHTDETDAEAQAGVRHEVIRAGRYKAEGFPFEPLSDDARAAMQAGIDNVYGMFVDAVAAHRGTTPAAVRAGYGEGRVLMGADAVAAGLADRVGTLDDVLAELTGDATLASAPRLRMTASAAAIAVTVAPLAAAPSTVAGEAAAVTFHPLAPAVPPARPAAIAVVTEPAVEARSNPVSDQTTAAPAAAPDVRVTRDANPQADAQREIVALAEQHAMTDRIPGWFAAGASLNTVQTEIRRELQARLDRGPVTRARVDLTEREERDYSFARAISATLPQNEGGIGRCFESEVSEQIAANLPAGYKPRGGLFVPTNIRAAGLDSATSTKGAELKFVKPGSFIEMLRNRARVLQAGATMISGLDGPVTFPKQNGAGTASWMGENGGSDVAESNLLLTTVSLAAKTLQSTTSFSRQLLRQSGSANVDVESTVRSDIAAVHGLAIDAAALFGTGSSNQPTGVYNTSGVGVVALGTNGAAPTYANMLALAVAIENANADELGSMGLISTPGIKATLKNTARLSNTIGSAIWSDENQVAGMSAYSTNQVQSNLTKGSGSALHAIYAGIWSQLLIGEFGAMELVTDPYRLKKQGMIEVTSFQMIDLAVRYAGAFAVIKDAISAF